MTVITVTTACAMLHPQHHERFEWQQGYGYDGYALACCPDYSVTWRVLPGVCRLYAGSRELEVRGHLVHSVVEMDRMLHEACLTVLFVRWASGKNVCCS